MGNNSKISNVQMKVKKTIEDYGLVKPRDGLILGVSGGPDSICLLHCLWSLGYAKGGRLHAVHLNHMLRGKDADDDQEYTESFCRSRNIPCHSFQKDVGKLAREAGLSFEDFGRQQRYKYFQETLNNVFGGIGKIIVAQNKNDQAETVLMRILRGTGINGLGAMDYIRDGVVIRPLLNVSRAEIEDYCEENKLAPRIDKTNQQVQYTRNRIRLELIPYIEKHFNNNIVSGLTSLADLAREDNKYMEGVTEEIFLKNWNEHEKSLLAAIVANEPVAIQRRLILKGLHTVGLDKNIGVNHVDSLLSMVTNGDQPKLAEFSDGYTVRFSYNKLWFLKKNLDYSQDFYYKIKRMTRDEMEALLKGKREMHLSGRQIERRFLDYEKLSQQGPEWKVRTRQQGDWIRPLGMQGRKKIKDYFIDNKIPAWKRDSIPLLAKGSEIAWVYGGIISENFKIQDVTKEILCIEYFQTL